MANSANNDVKGEIPSVQCSLSFEVKRKNLAENGNPLNKMKIYLAGPLFTQADRLWNRRIADELRGLDPSLEVLLPQDAAVNALENGVLNFHTLFQGCIEGIQQSDVIVANLDGSDSDSGTSFECGFAFALGKPVLGIRTDLRASEDRGLNAMLSQSCADLIHFPATHESVAALGALIFEKLDEVMRYARSGQGFRS
jgi:nucleoside 2-deoxyribosyltransferase